MISEWNGHRPTIHPSAFVHDSAQIIGKVTLGRHVSIWPNAVLRGDIEEIIIGDESNIQDSSLIHTDRGTPTVLGRRISVGHGVILHSCRVDDDCLIGMGSILLEGSRVEEECIVGAGALVSPGKIIPRGSLAIGLPARVSRELEEAEIARIRENAAEYLKLAESYRTM